MSQGYPHDTTSYLGSIDNLIYFCNSGGQEFSTPLVKLISTQRIDPYWHQKVLERYEVVFLEWSLNNLDSINTEVMLINHCRGLVKMTSVTTGASVRSIYESSRQTPTPPQRDQPDQYFSLLHNLFREQIKMLPEDNK